MIGNKVCFFTTLPSTNTFMKSHLDQYRDGDVIIANVQTEGRGRRNNKWVSKAGNVHASVYLDNAKRKLHPFQVVMQTSLAVIDTLDSFNVKAAIKYPNDVVIDRHKIAGILIETVGDDIVIGVGINVNFNDVKEYDFHPSSILLETSRIVDYRDVLSAFIKAFNDLEGLSQTELLTRYHQHSIVIGETIDYNGKRVLVKDINAQGELVLDDPNLDAIQPNEIILTAWYNE